MTDDEIRRIGADFIESRRQLLRQNPFQIDPTGLTLFNARWDYIDPLRMGLYVLTKRSSGQSAWVVDFDHIQHVCTNAAAFKQTPPEGSARVGEMEAAEAPVPLPVMSAQDEADHLESGEPLYLDGTLRAPSEDAKRSLELIRSLSDGTPLDAFRAPEELIDF